MDFEIEGDSYNCAYDYLEIRDGDNENSSLVGKFCGDPTLRPDPIVSTMNYVWIRFVTDGSVQNRGFAINYTTSSSPCGGILRDQVHGLLSSPIDTEYYPHGARCVWVIRTLPDTIIRLTWLSFVLESSSDCAYDFVEIFDDSGPNNQSSIGKFCGRSLPPTLTSVSNALTVVFSSDWSVSHDGFAASYVALDAALGSLIRFKSH
jgi:cubilin